ncbi:MAG TPA: patatin-like phospholipase family protein [Gaiellaceae bacterium]|nr:patatin-like phospholipase family protein [Gaiellaceae bacterium]
MTEQHAQPKLGLALSGGGHRAAFFHVGVLARLAELGLLRRVEVISTVSGGSIVGALYYLHVKNLLESKPDAEIGDADYVELVRAVEREYREAAATNVRGSGWANPLENFRMALPSYTRTDRVGELYEQRFYARAWGDRRKPNGRIRMRDLLIAPKGHEGRFDPDVENASRNAPVPILLLEATTVNTGHNWRFEAMYMGEPPRQGMANVAAREDVDKNTILPRTVWDDLPASCRDFPLGSAVVASACFPGGFPPMQVSGLYKDKGWVVELIDGGVHDNQGVEGLDDRGCTHLVISDGSGQMPDVKQPSGRLPAVLGRVVSIYGDAEREQRLLELLDRGDSVGFMHLQTGLPARTMPVAGEASTDEAQLPTAEFGVTEAVQRAHAEVRTDLDAFCEVEAWSLMADAYQLAGRILPTRTALASLGAPMGEQEWAFDAVAGQLAEPNDRYLELIRVSKQRFLKPARMTPGLLPLVLLLMLAGVAAAAWGLWLLLAPHGDVLFVAGLATLAALAVYANSEKPFVKPVAVALFDVALPALLALPLVLVAWLQLLAGRWWLSLGRARRL